jgi:hypothetical protein
MADGRLCIGMLKVSVYVMGSLLHKISEPAFSQSIFITHGEITAHLVNRDLQNQFWFIIISGCWQYQSGCKETDSQNQKQTF